MDSTMPLTEALFYILLAVRTPNHGYGIIQEIQKLTNNQVNLGPGTLYGAINSLLSKGYIELYSEEKLSRKKKAYLITKEGRVIFQLEVERLKEMVKNAGLMEEIHDDQV